MVTVVSYLAHYRERKLAVFTIVGLICLRPTVLRGHVEFIAMVVLLMFEPSECVRDGGQLNTQQQEDLSTCQTPVNVQWDAYPL
jgi:hypothetical protein